MSEMKYRCFVIMPFSGTDEKHDESYWTDHFERVLKPWIEEVPGVEAKRSKAARSNIWHDIVRDLCTADVVVADLTGHNPNVFLELGVRLSFRHGTITIREAEEQTKLPFDIITKGTIFYDMSSEEGREEFRDTLKNQVSDCIENPDRPDSSVLETITGRGSLFSIVNRQGNIRRLDAIINEANINIESLNIYLHHAQHPVKVGKTKSLPTHVIETDAIQLMSTDRYLDRDRNFYKLANVYFREMNIVKEQVRDWTNAKTLTENWITRMVPQYLPKAKMFLAELEKARRDLGNQV